MTEPPRSRFRSILRWTLPVGLAFVLLASWSLFLLGGMAAVIGWSLLISAGQLLAPLSLLVLVVNAVRKRRCSRPMWATLALALVAIWPGLWGFGLLTFAFPYSLESSCTAAVSIPFSRYVWRTAGGADSSITRRRSRLFCSARLRSRHRQNPVTKATAGTIPSTTYRIRVGIPPQMPK